MGSWCDFDCRKIGKRWTKCDGCDDLLNKAILSENLCIRGVGHPFEKDIGFFLSECVIFWDFDWVCMKIKLIRGGFCSKFLEFFFSQNIKRFFLFYQFSHFLYKI